MSELVLEQVADGPLVRLDARFGTGAAVVLGGDALALATLVELAGGARPPRRGRISFDGRPLHPNPALRRVAATLFGEEELLPFGRVSDIVAGALAARGESRPAREVLDAAELGTWSARRARDLEASERRTLALALALSHPNPRLLCLYEPLAAGRTLNRDFVLSGVRRAAQSGAVVLVATASLDDARLLAAVPWLLEGGILVPLSHATPPTSSGDRTFLVETGDARRLMEALAREPGVLGVRWHEWHTPDTLLVVGDDIENVASAIARAVAETRVSVQSVTLAPLSLDALFAGRQAALVGTSALAPTAAPATFGAISGAGALPPPVPPAGPAVASVPGLPELAPAPADQAVSMPTSFGDPTRPPEGTQK